MAGNFDMDESTQEAQESAKRVANMMSQPLKGFVRKGGRRAAKKIGKAMVDITKKLIKAIVNVIKITGVWGVVFLIVLLIIAAAFSYEKDERGSTSQMTLDPIQENPTSMTEDGYLKADALTESQALIDAYYKYLSCDSFQKVFIDSSGQIHRYKFSDVNQTADFAGLTDLYNKENYFYLSSYFLKMTDELFNNEEFYYPEQFIKPVNSDILPLENPDPEDAGKKFVTALPLVDDGSENAKIIKSKLSPTEPDLDGPYAIESTEAAGGGTPGTGGGTTGTEELPKRQIPDDATKELIAVSKMYESSDVTATDPTTGESKTINTLAEQGDTDTLGVWDYGFGSVLQYEAMTKDLSMDVSKISFTYHYHVIPWTEGTDASGNPTKIEDFDPATCCYEETYEITLGAETAASILNNIKDHVDSFESDSGTSGNTATLVACPSAAQINFMLANLSVKGDISPEDEALVGVYFDDDALQEAFGNATKSGGVYVKATKYPLKVPVITAAATFSGNLRYKYSMTTLTNDITNETGSSPSVEACWSEDCSTIEYATFTCGTVTNTCTIDRAGTISSTQPSALAEEASEPLGFQYVEDYGNNYQIFVPNKVRTDMDFRQRVYNKQEGADSLSSSEKASYDADGDGEVTVMDFLIKLGLLSPYSTGSLSATGGITQGPISASNQALMAAMGCGTDEEGQVRLLAKVIAAEAGPNKLDQLLVGAVVVNRVYSDEFPYAQSIMDVITAPNQYASWSNGSIQAREPTDEMLASARQVLSGEFAVPSNIVFQAAFKQGATTWLTNINGPGYYTHYYCCNGTPSPTDIFNRTAISEAQARDLAESLHQQDIANGYTSGGGSSGGGSGIAASPAGSSTLLTDDVWQGKKLYASQGFNLQQALSTMRQVSDRKNAGFLEKIYALGSAIADIFEQIQKFFSISDKLFKTEKDWVALYAANIALTDIRDTVIQAVTFSNQDVYSNVANEFDPDALQFLFVGEGSWAGSAQGTTGFGGTSMVPGTGSTFTGFGSPTSTHYSASSPWSAVTGSATIAIPTGTAVLAVGDTKVTEVEETDGKYKVVMTGTSDGKNLVITYENLASANVSVGSSLSKGDTVGMAGDGGVVMKLVVDGVNVDPMSYFYQPTFGSGVSFFDVLDSNGMIDEGKKNELSALINSANKAPSGPCDKWHNKPLNSRSAGECTWWAWGRGYQFCEENNCMPSNGFGVHGNGGNGYGNGGDYYANGAEDFQVDQNASANSWIVWKRVTPDSSGNLYGHVAFVEAVGADGTILISETWHNNWYNGSGILVRTIRNVGTASSPNYAYSSKYKFVGFVHLDQPK